MITGYNHNVKYGDTVYHVQTEDSGVDNPHIITHLFVGGNIIESRKVSYADKLQQPDLEKTVVSLMQNQHKSLLRMLIKGELDHKLAERSVNAAHLNGPAPLNTDAGQNTASFGMPAAAASKAPAKPAAPPPVPPLPAAAKPAPVVPPPAAAASAPTSADIAAEAAALFGLDTTSSFFGDAPPPPTTIIEATTLEKAFESNDESAVDSIFGEDLISEKSLDEVILSYLAEDMNE